MQRRTLAVLTLLAVTALSSTITPAVAYDGGRWGERDTWHERDWRRHEWREHAWRERYYVPPSVVVRPYGTYAPPRAYYPNPAYYR